MPGDSDEFASEIEAGEAAAPTDPSTARDSATQAAGSPTPIDVLDVASTRYLTQQGFRTWRVLGAAIGITAVLVVLAFVAAAILSTGLAAAVPWGIILVCFGWYAIAQLRRRYRGAYDSIVGDTPAALAASVERALPRLRGDDAADFLLKLAMRLAAQRARALVLRIAPASEHLRVVPFDVTFEPQPLNEQQSALVAAAKHGPGAATSAQSAEGAPSGGAEDMDAPTTSPITALQRRLRLSGQGIAIAFLAFALGRALLDSISRRTPTPSLFAWAALIAFVLFVPTWGFTGAPWYVVPGAIICRRPARTGWVLRLFRPRECVLCVAQLSPGRWCAVVADGTDCERQLMTPTEARFLLAAWLSPLPPPPEARFSDLMQ